MPSSGWAACKYHMAEKSPTVQPTRQRKVLIIARFHTGTEDQKPTVAADTCWLLQVDFSLDFVHPDLLCKWIVGGSNTHFGLAELSVANRQPDLAKLKRRSPCIVRINFSTMYSSITIESLQLFRVTKGRVKKRGLIIKQGFCGRHKWLVLASGLTLDHCLGNAAFGETRFQIAAIKFTLDR
jgi:hypothetical protein